MAKSAVSVVRVILAVFLMIAARPANAQIINGTVTGTVTDASGGVLPGATVVLVSETQGTKTAPVVTNDDGSYTVPLVRADTYTVEVTMPSFKPVSRKGVTVSGGDRVTVERLVLEIGGQTEVVTVQAEAAPVIQAASGERSGVIAQVQLESLPTSATGHGFNTFLTLVPGMSGPNRLGGGGENNYMIDGISAMDTGSNALILNPPVDQIAEVKVITHGFQAEYGRSSGFQVSAVTKSGTNQFHGTLYDYERHARWNENSWVNSKNGDPKPILDERDWGFTVGGPIGKPGGSNKLFFFYSQEFNPRTVGGAVTRLRLPTELERRGDFSQTLDNNAALFPFIKDPLLQGTCSATSQAACFADGGVLGRIPTNRLYGPGIAILNQYPLPNEPNAPGSGQSWNFSSVAPTQKRLSYQPAVRGDWQISPNLRVTGKFSGNGARVLPNIGSIPGFNDTIQKFPWVLNGSGTVNWTLNPTTYMEISYGMNQNQVSGPNPPIGPLSNRYNINCPANLAAQIANCTGGALPFLFGGVGPGADVPVNPDTYEARALEKIGAPFFQNNTFQLPPVFGWGNTRIAGAPPNIQYPNFFTLNRIQDFVLSLTKVAGRHTMKAGFYVNHSYKPQNFNGTQGLPTFQGNLTWGVDTSNPLEAGFPFADAALGVYSSYGQQSAFVEGSWIYNNVEWYVQDNWKVNRKLTLDYGLRFVHQTPTYDQLRQNATFLPEQYSIANAPYLYVPACPGGLYPCPNTRQAMDPRSGQLLGPGSQSLIGTVILGSGNPANGLRRAGDGISEAGYEWPWLGVAPRFGAAYDLTGQQKIVLRGSVGLYFDRPDGNTVFSTVGNPPVATSTQSQWGFLGSLANPQFQSGPVPVLNSYQYDAPLPKDWQWNAGVQLALPWQSAVDVSYVGHHMFDAVGQNQGLPTINVNTIDLGAALPGTAGIDPTNGAPLPNNLLREIRGYGNVNFSLQQYWRTYHSLQTSYNRRFSRGVSFGVNWTWSISDRGNNFAGGLGAFSSPNLRLDHNPDGTYSVRADQATAQELFGDQGTIAHIIKGHFIWQLPTLKANSPVLRAVGHVINDWQLAGIVNIDSGALYDVTYTYNSGGSATALTGSPDYNGRIVIPDMGIVGSGCSSNQYGQFNNAMRSGGSNAQFPLQSVAFSGPQVGSVGLESGKNLFSGCGNRTLDLSIQRSIRLGGGRALEFRADVYNFFNTVIYTGRANTVQFNSPTDLTVRNSQFLADGTLDPTRLTPNRAGFGAATAAAPLRAIQAQIRFRF